MKLLRASALAAASLARLAATLSTFSPTTGISYSIGIPSSSSISSSSTGGIYIQLSAPSTYQWVALGIGRQMASSTIFIMFADGKGNVTISARDGGQGHVEPTLDSTLQAGVSLLEGSGIVGSNMVANFHCSTCQLLSAKGASSSPWISAWNQGSPLNSNDPNTEIEQHGPSDVKQLSVDLSQASISEDENPFVASSSSGSEGSNSTSSSPPASSSSSASSGSGSSVVVGTSASTIASYDKAHGALMGVVVIILFPLGSILMRLVRNPWLHAGVQVLSLGGLIAGLGIGVKLAQFRDYLWNNTHTRLGVAIVALFILQPFLGLAHHYTWTKTKSRSPVSHIHIWYGRAIMILAVINGGLGLQLAANSRTGEIVYGVLAGVMAVLYVIVVVVKRKGPVGLGGRLGSKTEGDSSPRS